MIPTDIHLARTGPVTSRNYQRLGYRRLTRGVYGRVPALPDHDPYEQRRASFLAHTFAVMAAYQGTGAVLYGVTALQVLGVELPEPLEDWERCHVLLPRGGFHPQRDRVVLHRTDRPVVPRWHRWGLPLLHPVEHWIQLRGATDDQLIEVGDGLVRRQRPLVTWNGLVTALGQCAGRPGASRVAGVLKWVRPGTDSLYETRTRLILVHAGLPCPIVNLLVDCPAVGETYRIDMSYAPEKLGVEYDGRIHGQTRQQMDDDALRRRHLQDDGWMLITVTAGQLANPPGIVRSVESALVLRRAALTQAW